ncbi:phosphatidylinositol N-acetylglucosaminyltransferase subunit H [Cherax quadricarinatus]|uniref:phosphatidylinositol N-acetylglucosaminyltransferase subunit H n=1 Tax=Cherax quadricarinatus TaxID=27406 RepID=UPI00387EB561
MYNQKKMSGTFSSPVEEYRNVVGEIIFVDVRLQPSLCHGRALEVCVSGKHIQLIPWLGYTSILAVIAFMRGGRRSYLHTLHLAWLVTVVIIQLVTFLYRIHGKVVSETLLLMAGTGVQTTATFYTGKQRMRFIPWKNVIDVIIAETISLQRVLFYMALLVRGEKAVQNPKLIPLFLVS